MRKSTFLVFFAMTTGIVVLTMLGNWQVQRLAWKEELIAMTISRSKAVAKPLSEIESIWSKTNDVDYMAVSFTGQFNHNLEMYYYTTWNGQAGWNVITPLTVENNKYALVNRGFVPLKLRNPELRPKGQLNGKVKMTGLARNPILTKPNTLMPDNSIKRRELFWKSQNDMISLFGKTGGAEILPFMIDVGKNNLEYPLSGTTRMSFPNSHLQYAATWYGLALALLVVGSVFLYGRRKQPA